MNLRKGPLPVLPVAEKKGFDTNVAPGASLLSVVERCVQWLSLAFRYLPQFDSGILAESLKRCAFMT